MKYAFLFLIIPIISTSHNLLHELYKKYGEETVDKELKNYFD